MKKSIYITTTLPYVNADPHLGFALEMVQADAWVRTQRFLGNDVVFNTGTDEHGMKIYQNALEKKVEPQTYVDEYAAKFKKLKDALDLTYTNFIRTTDPHHKKAAQEFWKRCLANGDIYKKNYQVKYCVGCELAKTESELVDGVCPLHPNKEIILIDEENYFFKFSAYQEKLLALYEKNPDFVKPAHRLEEIKNFVKGGLEDFSISRLKEKMPWGVAVPNDDAHIMYVWFDALINYISTLSWPEDEENFKKYWPGIQVAGKDNLRQQSSMWQAMLMSAQLPPSEQIFIHGFITSNGQKMSKSIGNVVDPYELVEKYGSDAVRYYLLREIPALDDGDFSYDRMNQIYNSDLANELGNLVSRVTTLAAKDGIVRENTQEKIEDITSLTLSFQFNEALERLWNYIKKMNKEMNEKEPWKKSPEERKEDLLRWLGQLHEIGWALLPFMPGVAEAIQTNTVGAIEKQEPLFPRIKS